MDTLLTEAWMRGRQPVRILDEASVAVVRESIRARGAEQGLTTSLVERACVVASELGHNQLRHARYGELAASTVDRDGARGIELRAADRGEGLVGFEKALLGMPSTEGSLGVGVASVRRLSHEVDLESRRGEGTCVTARLFDALELTRHPEVGVVGQPHPHERQSADGAVFVRTDEGLLAAVIDGVGHGPVARADTLVATEEAVAEAQSGPAAILRAVHRRLAGRRGVVMNVLQLALDGSFRHAGVGNITTRICGPGKSRGLAGRPQVLGSPGPLKLYEESGRLQPDDVVLMFSDGLRRRTAVPDDDRALLRQHPVVIAEQCLERFVRTTDDAIILAIR